MKLTKRFGSMLLAGALAVGAISGCSSSSSSNSTGSASASSSSSGDVKIGYVNMANTDVFCMSRMEAFVAAAEAEGWEVSCADSNNDVQKQIDQTNSFLAQGVDAVVIIPDDAAGIVPAVQACNSAGVPCILIGNGVEGDDDLDYTFVGSPHTESGYMEGELFADLIPENGSYCYLAGTAGLDHAAMRREGTESAFADKGRDDITKLDDQDGDYVKDEGMRITESWIQKYSDGEGGVTFDAIISANDQMALGAMEALKSAGVAIGTDEGEVLVCGIDGTDDALQAVKDGDMALTVLQDADGQGAAAVEAIQTYLDGSTPEAEIMVPYIAVTADNVDEYLD